MFSIYSTEKALVDICIGAKYPNWHAIAKKQTEIKSNATIKSILDDENPINIFSQMTGVNIVSCDDYFDRINNHPEAVLENPCGAFILDVDKIKANEIQKDYGVICQSDNDIEDGNISDILFYKKGISSEINDTSSSWGEFLIDAKTIPSNFLIINDRNLFVNDDNLHKKGIENLIEILKSILPDSLICEYHILIVTCEFKRGIELSKIAMCLSKEMKNIRPYPVIIEIVHMKSHSCTHYDKTHNRRLISNYSVMRVDHKIKAFDGNKSLCDQNIDFHTIYSDGINNNSDCPEKTHRKTIKDITLILNHGKKNPDGGYYAYAINGKCKDYTVKNINGEYKDLTAEDIKNRLLK